VEHQLLQFIGRHKNFGGYIQNLGAPFPFPSLSLRSLGARAPCLKRKCEPVPNFERKISYALWRSGWHAFYGERIAYYLTIF
jgi:hypothetical protein